MRYGTFLGGNVHIWLFQGYIHLELYFHVVPVSYKALGALLCSLYPKPHIYRSLFGRNDRFYWLVLEVAVVVLATVLDFGYRPVTTVLVVVVALATVPESGLYPLTTVCHLAAL